MDEIIKAISFMALFLAGLTAHGLCIKYGLLSALTKPIDAGHTFRGRRLFGANKTFRGVLAVGAGTAIGFLLRAVVDGAATHETNAAWLS